MLKQMKETASGNIGRRPEGSTMYVPTQKKILGFTTDLQLLSKGTPKKRIPNYRVAKIVLWHLWPSISAPYVLNVLNLVSNERWVYEKLTMGYSIVQLLIITDTQTCLNIYFWGCKIWSNHSEIVSWSPKGSKSKMAANFGPKIVIDIK